MMAGDQEMEVPSVLEVADSGDVKKEKKEKHKKEKKHKHKHKHKSGHKRSREDEDGAEVEIVDAAVKPRSPKPEHRANGKVTHDVADKSGSDCESGEILTAEEKDGQTVESLAVGDRDDPNAAGRPLGTVEELNVRENGSERHKSQDADRSAPQKRLRADDGVEDAPEVKPIHQDSSHAKDGASKGDRPKHGSERHDRKRGAEPEKGIVPDKEVESQRARSRDDRRTREERHPRSSKERRPDDIRDIDRRRERSADRRREPERSGRGSSHGGDRDVRYLERGRDPRALGRDADPRARGSGADRDWGHRGPTRDLVRDRYHDWQGDRDRDRAGRQGRYGGHDRDRGRGQDRRDDRRDDRRHREPEPRKTKEELEAEAKKEAELAAQMEKALEGDEDEEQRLIEERRKRRQEILAKHQQDRELSERVAAPTASELHSNGFMDTSGRMPGAMAGASPSTQSAGVGVSRGVSPVSGSMPASPAHPAVDALSRPQSANYLGVHKPGSDLEEEEEEDDVTRVEEGEDLWQTRRDEEAIAKAPAADTAALGEAQVGKGPLTADADDPAVAGSDDEKKHKLEAQAARHQDTLDIFAEQVDDDMFGPGTAAPAAGAPVVKKGLLDNYDDVEGYYNFQVGEIMDDRYEVFDTLGKGVFSTVLRARDTAHKNALGKHPEVAVKVIRSNDVMYKAGQTEMVILRKLSGADPNGKRHCVRMLRSFEYRQHLCLVFESMDLNLRELTKKYGRGIGLNIRAVRPYAAQMFWALYHLQNCGVLHSDIKPDNILVSEDRTSVKLCDFGSAMFQGENEVTPYLVSRYYRSPEVILGLKYDTPMDIWSIGCVIYELYTGKILFPGRSNNEMLKLMMDVQGPFPKKMLRKGAFADRHFDLKDPNCSFYHIEEDPVTRQPVRRIVSNPVAKKKFSALLAGSEGDKRQVAQLADLLERMMNLDPEKRITPKEALRHPFIKDSSSAAKSRK